MERLYELHTSGEYDLIVLDTPPSRNALDFLEAPGRLTRFVEGRALRFLLRPGMRAGGWLRGGRADRRCHVPPRPLGARGWVRGHVRGLRPPGGEVSALLASDRTTFLLVTVPQVEPLAEADFFWRALRERELPFGGMIVNKVHPSYVGGAPAARTRLRAKTKRALRDAGVPDPTAGRAARTSSTTRRSPTATARTSRASSAGSARGRSSRCRCSTTTSTTWRAWRPWAGTSSPRRGLRLTAAPGGRGRTAARRACTTRPAYRSWPPESRPGR